MIKKENQRIALTKQLLQNAFVRMLGTTPIHALSIRELCKEAGINRTTFYNHYGSQYDLLEDIGQRFLDSIAERLNHTRIADRENIHQRVTMVLEYLLENRELSVMLLNNNIDPGFAERIFTLPQITDMMNAALIDCLDEQRHTAIVSFVIYGCYKLLQDWINEKNHLPPEEQAKLMLELARRVCP